MYARVKVAVVVAAVSPGTLSPQLLPGEVVLKEVQASLGSLSLILGVQDKWRRRGTKVSVFISELGQFPSSTKPGWAEISVNLLVGAHGVGHCFWALKGVRYSGWFQIWAPSRRVRPHAPRTALLRWDTAGETIIRYRGAGGRQCLGLQGTWMPGTSHQLGMECRGAPKEPTTGKSCLLSQAPSCCQG